MTVMERNTTESTTAVVAMPTQYEVAPVSSQVSTPTITTVPKVRVALVRNLPRDAATGGLGGGSMPLNGSLFWIAERRPGQNRRSRNNAANGSDGLRLWAITLAGGR